MLPDRDLMRAYGTEDVFLEKQANSAALPIAARLAYGMLMHSKGRSDVAQAQEQRRQAEELNAIAREMEIAEIGPALRSMRYSRAPVFVAPSMARRTGEGMGYDSDLPVGMDAGMVRLASASGAQWAHLEKDAAVGSMLMAAPRKLTGSAPSIVNAGGGLKPPSVPSLSATTSSVKAAPAGVAAIQKIAFSEEDLFKEAGIGDMLMGIGRGIGGLGKGVAGGMGQMFAGAGRGMAAVPGRTVGAVRSGAQATTSGVKSLSQGMTNLGQKAQQNLSGLGQRAQTSMAGVGQRAESALSGKPMPAVTPAPATAPKAPTPGPAATPSAAPPTPGAAAPPASGGPGFLDRMKGDLGGGKWKYKLPLLAGAALGTYGAYKGLKAGLNWLSSEPQPYSYNQGGAQLRYGVNEYGY